MIGLSTALELGRMGAQCQLYGARHHETASLAAAGLLAPSVGNLSSAVRPFFEASLARYPEFVESLRQFEPSLSLILGLLDVSTQPTEQSLSRGDRLSAQQLADVDPSVFGPHGAVFHARDAAIDNRLLVSALHDALAATSSVSVVHDDPVEMIDLEGSEAAVRTRSDRRVEAQRIVLAAGAWSAAIAGLPRRIPVRPLKGQMLSVAASTLRHSIMGDDIYLVPRPGEIAIGATVEEAGFDATVDPLSIETLRQSAIRVCPSLRDAPVIRTWAGIRPATPDMLPVLGADPSDERLIYACGHSKNGILLAPATGAAIARVALGKEVPFDLMPFRVDRFSATHTSS